MLKVSSLHNWISQLDKALRLQIDARMSERDFCHGESVYRQGDRAHCLYQVASGRVKVANYSPDGKELLFSILRAGDCFGEMSLIDAQPRLNHVSALGDTRLKLLAKADFLEFYDGFPEVAKSLNVMFCRRLRFSFHGMEGLSLMSVRERLAVSLLRFATRHESDLPSVEVSQEELGKMLNATRQSIGKELKYFESQGLIELRYGKVILCDVKALLRDYEILLGDEALSARYHDRPESR